jgi:uncharacterized protein (TIGR02186 family)
MRRGWGLCVGLTAALLVATAGHVLQQSAEAQTAATQTPAPPAAKKRTTPPLQATSEPKRGRQVPVGPTAPAAKADEARAELPPETVQADVSTRNVSVTSSFTGTEIVVFGAVDNSWQPGAESGFYDVVVVIEGTPSKIAVRKKSRMGGIWLNTRNAGFERVPNYYAIWSTRPLDEIASEATMIGYEIGFDHVRMTPVGGTEAQGSSSQLPAADAGEFRKALVRLKTRQGLYVKNEFGVSFIGRSLFRANISLPANVTLGPFDTRVYLFRNEKLLSQYDVRLNLEREGVERHLHDFAMYWPLFYGLATVLLAAGMGMVAATLSGKSFR